MHDQLVASDPVALANRLRPALLRLNRELRRETASLGVTGGQAALLHLISRSPGVGVRSLAGLEAAGLVRRVPSTDDRRRVGLELTEEGVRMLRAVRRRRTAWLAQRLGRLDPAELDALERAVGPLARLLEVDE
jgi:DNA-binding MarR family transcriptional regulator